MHSFEIGPEHVSVFHSFSLIIQLFDAFDGYPPQWLIESIQGIFKEVCRIEGANTDGNMQVGTQMMYCAHFIQNEEATHGIKRLTGVLKKIQEVVVQTKENPMMYELLGVNKMFVDAILSK